MRGLVNIRYAFAALLVALLLWVVAHSTSPVERPFDLPVRAADIPDELVVTGQNYDRVNIHVRGSRAALASLSASDLEYVADLSTAAPGDLSQEVDVTKIERTLPRGAEIVSRLPVSIDFVLERKHTRSVKVQADVTGTPAQGYELGTISIVPASASVTGARSEVLGLKRVETETVDISGATASIVRRVKLMPAGRHVWFDEVEAIDLRIDIRAKETPELADLVGPEPRS